METTGDPDESSVSGKIGMKSLSDMFLRKNGRRGIGDRVYTTISRDLLQK